MIYGFDHPFNHPASDQHFVQHDSGLSSEEIDRIRAMGDALDTVPIKLYGRHDESHVNARKSELALTDETRWLYDRMAEVGRSINAENFRFDLTGFYESFYYQQYEAPTEHFNWHLDVSSRTPAPRKLSLVLQLSDPSEYEGGDFDVLAATSHVRAIKQKGIVTAFPSFKIHRVTPVTRGIRRSLVMFLVGPNFR